MSNPWEAAGRLRKTYALVAELQAAHISSDLAVEMDRVDWIACAAKAKVIPPSEETIAAVIEALKHAESLRPTP